ncbi:Death-associated inhibitor of apoptosis 1, partial [Carabus blaptoides fortunei]
YVSELHKTMNSAQSMKKELESMKKELDRLMTFTDWPHHFLDPRVMAKVGLYAIHFEDAVRPSTLVQRLCPFIRGANVGNIPLDPADIVDLPSREQAIRTQYGIQVRPYLPAYPNYATLEARLRTFKEWPLCLKQKSGELANAGFFYTNKSDQAMCFSCGGGLKDWMEADDPWEQHARWFTKCSFVRMVKGREFIREVCKRLPVILTAGADLRPASTSSGGGGNNMQPHEPVSTSSGGEKKNDDRLCKICYAEELGVVFLPCGHIVACVKCVQSLSTCAVCRQPFNATVRAFLS